MAEIDEKCSVLCAVNMKAIMGDYRKLLEKWWEIEAREGLINRKHTTYQREQEENLMYSFLNQASRKRWTLNN